MSCLTCALVFALGASPISAETVPTNICANATITLRAEKGSALTHAEMDDNFENVADMCLVDTEAEFETWAGGINWIVSTEIDTEAEIEALAGGINLIVATEIDNSTELAAILTNETGSGAVVFSGSPIIASAQLSDTPTFTGTPTVGNGAGNDNLSFAEEATNPACVSGDYRIWANSVDAKLKKCEDGVISDLDAAGAGSGDVTDVGNCSTGACFTADGTGNSLTFEGATADTFEILLTAADPGADYSITLPAETGTACTTGSVCTGYEADTHASEHQDGAGDEVAVTGGMMSADFGDFTCDGTATGCTVDANAIALATDTTGNFVATIADAGSTTITVTGSGSENAAVTLDAIDLNCTDCIGTTEIADSYTLNVGDTMTGNLVMNDGVGNSPTVQFSPQTGSPWSVFSNDSTDNLEIQISAATGEIVNISNIGAGTAGLAVDGTIQIAGNTACHDGSVCTGYEAETHASEHEDTGGDEIAVTGGMMSADFGDWTCDGTATGCTVDDNAVDGTDIAIGGDAQGDIVYYDGTDYVVLAAGTDGQQLETNGAAANPSWEWPSRVLQARKGSAGTIAKGSPVYISAWNPSGFAEVEQADADTAGSMPAIGLAREDLTNGGTTTVLLSGVLSGLDTSSFSVGDEIYVDTDGDTCSTFPTCVTATVPSAEANQVQKMAQVVRSHASQGTVVVFGAGRANAVSNLDSAAIFVGNSSNQAAAVDMSGDVTINNTGVTAIGADVIVPADVDETQDYSFTTLSGKQDRNNTAVDDDDCTGEQGLWWYDTTDSAFEFCNASSGAPTALGGGGSGDVTDVGDCTTGACFTADGAGNSIVFEGATADGFETTLTAADTASSDKTLTLPDATDTLVGRATTDTLTNKTIATASNTITINAADISDQNAGTDITADLEEESHAAEHDGVGTVNNGEAIDTASQEAGFLEDGGVTSLTCGAAAGGKMQVMDDGSIEYCDGATTSVLQQGFLDADGADDDVPEAADYSNLTGGTAITNSPTGTINLDLTASIAITGDWDFGGGGIEIENGTTPPACTVGQLYLDTDATSGQQLMACEGGTFVLQGDGGAGGGDSIEIEDGDNAGTFTAIDTTARYDDSGDINFTHADGGAGGPDIVTATVRADSVALTTDTTGNYVSDLTAGAGITVTGCGSEGANCTIAIDPDERTAAHLLVEGEILASDEWTFRLAPWAGTMTRVDCEVYGGTSVAIDICDGEDRGDDTCTTSILGSALTCDTTGASDTTLSATGFVARDKLTVVVTTATGTPTDLEIFITATVD